MPEPPEFSRCRWSDSPFSREFIHLMDLVNSQTLETQNQLHQSKVDRETFRGAFEASQQAVIFIRNLREEERKQAIANQHTMQAHFQQEIGRLNLRATGLEEMLDTEQCENADLKTRLNQLQPENEALQSNLQAEREGHRRTVVQCDDAYHKALLHLDMLDQREARVKELESSIQEVTEHAFALQKQLAEALEQVTSLEQQLEQLPRRRGRGPRSLAGNGGGEKSEIKADPSDPN